MRARVLRGAWLVLRAARCAVLACVLALVVTQVVHAAPEAASPPGATAPAQVVPTAGVLQLEAQCCDADHYLKLGASCARDECYDRTRTRGAAWWFSLPYRFGWPIESLIVLNGLLILLGACLATRAALRAFSAPPRGTYARILTGATFLGCALVCAVFFLPVVRTSLADTPAAAFALIGVALLWSAHLRPGPRTLAAAGLALGTAAFIRPYYLYPVLGVVALYVVAWLCGRQRRWSELVFVLALLPIGIQYVTTWSVTGRWSYIDPAETTRWTGVHLANEFAGYDTLLPMAGKQWPSDCRTAGGLKRALETYDVAAIACVLGSRTAFYFGTYVGKTYIQSAAADATLRRPSVVHLCASALILLLCGYGWVRSGGMRSRALASIGLFAVLMLAEALLIIPEQRFVIALEVVVWIGGLATAGSLLVAWRRPDLVPASDLEIAPSHHASRPRVPRRAAVTAARFATAAAMCGALLLFLSRVGSPHLLEIEITSAQPLLFQIYFDTGQGYSASSTTAVAVPAGRNRLLIPLPDAPLRGLRLDPDDKPFEVTFHSIVLRGAMTSVSSTTIEPASADAGSHRVETILSLRSTLPLPELKPFNQIASSTATADGLRVRSDAAANDGALYVDVAAGQSWSALATWAVAAGLIALALRLAWRATVTVATRGVLPRWTASDSGVRWRLVAAVLAVLFLTVYWRYIGGGDLFVFCGDISSDTCYSYWPTAYHLAEYIRSFGWPTWSFSAGLGLYIGIHSDPFYYVNGIAGADYTAQLRIVVYALKIGLAALFFRQFLRTSGLRSDVAALGAIVFAFCGYNALGASWDILGSEMVVFSATLAALAHLVRSGDGAPLRLCFAVGCLVHVLLPFQLGLLALCFVGVHAFAAQRGVRWWFSQSMRAAANAVAGALVAAVVFLPALYYMTENPRVSGGASHLLSILAQLQTFSDWPTLKAILYGYYGKEALGAGAHYSGFSNYFEGPTLYTGWATLLLGMQALQPRAAPAARRAAALVFCVAIAYAAWPALRYAVFGFQHTVFRISTLWLSTALLCTALLGLQTILSVGVHRRLLTASIVLVGLPLLPLAAGWIQGSAITYAAFCACMLVVYAALLHNARKPDTARYVAAVTLICVVWSGELVLYSRWVQSMRTPLPAADLKDQQYFDSAYAAVQSIKQRDASWYRMEKGFNSTYLNDAYVQGYRGTQTYNFPGRSLTDINDFFGVERPFPAVSFIGSFLDDPALLAIACVKYLVLRPSQQAPQGFEPYDDVAGLSIFRNRDVLPLGRVMHRVVERARLASIAAKQRAAWLRSQVAVDSVELKQKSIVLPPLAPGTVAGSAPPPVLADSEPFVPREFGEKHMAGPLDVRVPGILVLAIPYDAGWRVVLDGVTLPTFRVNSSFLGASIDRPGHHELQLRFEPPFGRVGLVVTVLGSVMHLMLWWRNRRRSATAVVSAPAPA